MKKQSHQEVGPEKYFRTEEYNNKNRNLMDGLKSRMVRNRGKNRELKYVTVEITQSEKQREKQSKKY